MDREKELAARVADSINARGLIRSTECRGDAPHDFGGKSVRIETMRDLAEGGRLTSFCNRCHRRFAFRVTVEERASRHVYGCPQDGDDRDAPCAACDEAVQRFAFRTGG